MLTGPPPKFNGTRDILRALDNPFTHILGHLPKQRSEAAGGDQAFHRLGHLRLGVVKEPVAHANTASC